MIAANRSKMAAEGLAQRISDHQVSIGKTMSTESGLIVRNIKTTGPM